MLYKNNGPIYSVLTGNKCTPTTILAQFICEWRPADGYGIPYWYQTYAGNTCAQIGCADTSPNYGPCRNQDGQVNYFNINCQ